MRRKSPQDVAPLVSFSSSAPLDLLCIDYLSLEPSKGGIENILVITDHFSRYAAAVPVRSTKAKPTAKVLFDLFITHYGFPARLHSDQGKQFESAIIRELCNLAGIQKSKTTPYHPQGNPVERFNKTLISMLGTLADDKKKNWKAYVGPLVHAYNCTKNDATGYSPFYLMYGRQPRLPIDLILGTPTNAENIEYHTYVADLKKLLSTAYDTASRVAAASKDRHKKLYDRQTRGASLQVGDHVLVRNLSIRGKHKIADKWEEQAYQVISQPDDSIPVYVVSPLDNKNRTRTLHRNMLLPIDGLPTELMNTQKMATPEPSQPSVHIADSLSDSSDSDSEDWVVHISDYDVDEANTSIPDVPSIPDDQPQPLPNNNQVGDDSLHFVAGNSDVSDAESASNISEVESLAEGELLHQSSSSHSDNDSEVSDQEQEPSPLPPRTRRLPAKYRSGDYVLYS